MWFLNGPTFLGGVYGPTLPTSWTVNQLADFNHDGNPDYMLNNNRVTALWYLSGNVVLGGAYGPTIPSGWRTLSQTQPCYLSIAPTSPHYFQGGGGPANIYVSTLDFGCVWYANPVAIVNGVYTTYPWIHIVNHQTWVGSGHTTYTVDPNNTTSPRTGYISIVTKDGGQLYTITQDGLYSPGWTGTWTGTATGRWYFSFLTSPCYANATVPISVTFNADGTCFMDMTGVPVGDVYTCNQTGTNSYTNEPSGVEFGTNSVYFVFGNFSPAFTGTRSGNTVTGTVSGSTVGTFTITKQ